MVMKEYGTGRWLCYDCYFRREVPKGTKETLINPVRNRLPKATVKNQLTKNF
jgi:hypothetical protein